MLELPLLYFYCSLCSIFFSHIKLVSSCRLGIHVFNSPAPSMFYYFLTLQMLGLAFTMFLLHFIQDFSQTTCQFTLFPPPTCIFSSSMLIFPSKYPVPWDSEQHYPMECDGGNNPLWCSSQSSHSPHVATWNGGGGLIEKLNFWLHWLS